MCVPIYIYGCRPSASNYYGVSYFVQYSQVLITILL
jgi:hypothetical protein